MPIVEVNGRELHYAEAGHGPLAILIHGYPLDHTLWLDQLSGLSDLRRVVAVDLPGYGMSERVTGRPLTMEALAEDVAGLVEGLEYEQADIVGLSMGGYVALALFEAYPPLFRSLVLSNTKAGADSEEGKAGREAQAQAVVSEGRASLAAKLVGALLAPSHDLTAAARLRTMVEAAPVETIVASLRGMAARPDRTALLSSINVPTLVISGEEDALIPPLDSHEMSTAIPGSEFVVIPGAGHLCPIERPVAFTEALRGFWE
ncbi:MAG: alpha/beta hydrolase [Acidimicrobiia bacterium]|jgi:pimeloyl-ACP methyl ester carboxylesterase|nr:alpha/beta hydrolase [Acidimicrobiia bacterium]